MVHKPISERIDRLLRDKILNSINPPPKSRQPSPPQSGDEKQKEKHPVVFTADSNQGLGSIRCSDVREEERGTIELLDVSEF